MATTGKAVLVPATKRDFELEYWRLAGCQVDAAEKAEMYLGFFGAFLPRKGMGAKRVLELGPGPKDGCLHHERLASAFVRVGIDPYYPDYEAAGWCPDADGVLRLPGTADQIPGSPQEGKYDIVLACNALDHHPAEHGSVAANCAGAVAAVAPGGRLYVWMHTREPEDLDLGHDTPATEWDLLRPMLQAGDWRVWRCTALRADPVNGGPWRTIVLIAERLTTWVP